VAGLRSAVLRACGSNAAMVPWPTAWSSPKQHHAPQSRVSANLREEVSTQSKLFAAYFGVGLVLMILAFIVGRAKRGLKITDPFVDGGPLAAGLLILIALLWPAWLFWMFFQKEKDETKR
jgi:hypothetical protein